MTTAYTDGSANWKTGEGGCGAYIKYDDGSESAISKGFYQTKTGRMEIMALLSVLRLCKDDLIVYSDSEYVVNAFALKRLEKWKRKMFIGIKNPDLWKEVSRLMDSREGLFEIHHIKGHQKVTDEHTEGNYYADALADYKQHETREKDMSDEIWLNEKSNKDKKNLKQQ